MAFRVHFTSDDLLRVSLAQEPNPLSETIFSLRLLHLRRTEGVYAQWRRWSHTRLPRSVHLLRALVPAPHGFCPDFLTPTGVTDLDAGLEEVLRTPKSFLRKDMEAFARLASTPVPPWSAALANGTPGALEAVSGAVRDWHHAAIAPVWHHLRAQFETARATAAKAMLTGGLDSVLSTLHPTIRWTPPVLELACPDHDWDIHLGGRGLILAPSFFIGQEPAVNLDPDLPPVVIYPVTHDDIWSPSDNSGDAEAVCRAKLAALLGHGRATVLEVLAARQSTGSELARRTGLSPATVSHHTTVLRESGLITTQRTGMSVRHAITALGNGLVRGESGPALR